jgi:hypothetical protein
MLLQASTPAMDIVIGSLPGVASLSNPKGLSGIVLFGQRVMQSRATGIAEQTCELEERRQ